jgi:hypothetical protein
MLGWRCSAHCIRLLNAIGVALMIVAGVLAIKSYASLGAAATMLMSSSIAVAIKIVVFARKARPCSIDAATVPAACSSGPAGSD